MISGGEIFASTRKRNVVEERFVLNHIANVDKKNAPKNLVSKLFDEMQKGKNTLFIRSQNETALNKNVKI